MDVERDLADLHEMYSDPEWAASGYVDASRDLDDTRAQLAQEFGDNGGLTWSIRLRPGHIVIGVIGVFSDQGSPIRGMSWYLRRDHWGRGLMSEAARTTLGYLLDQPTISGVEAWIDSRNHRSIGVARRAGLDLVGRLPRVYDHETAQSLVMARAAEPSDPAVMGVRPTLLVRDVASTVGLLVDVLGLELRFQYGEPAPEFARLGLTRWSDGNGIDVRRHTGSPLPVAVVSFDLGEPVDSRYDAARVAGLVALDAPSDMPWARRECTVQLPEGHGLLLSGPLRPPH